jgi:hypothetical protein
VSKELYALIVNVGDPVVFGMDIASDIVCVPRPTVNAGAETGVNAFAVTNGVNELIRVKIVRARRNLGILSLDFLRTFDLLAQFISKACDIHHSTR